MTAEESLPARNFDANDLARVIRTRSLLFLLVTLLVFAPSAIVVLSLTPEYRATATILVESQQIPQELVRTTVTGYVDERIQFTKQKVLTRANVLEVIREFKLYPAIAEREGSTTLVESFRDDVELELQSARVGVRSESTVAFDLSYYSEFPEQARAVANKLVSLFLSENARTRAERAEETTVFLKEEGEKLLGEIKRLEGQVASFKLDNREAMPEMFELNMSLVESAQENYQTYSREIERLTIHQRRLELQLLSQTGSGVAKGTSLFDLRRQLADAQVDRRKDHPEVQRIIRQIEAAERADISETESIGSESGLDPVTSDLELQIEANRKQVEALIEDRQSTEFRLENLRKQMLAAPEVEQRFAALSSELEAARLKYGELRNKEFEARIAQSLEAASKGERFTLLEPPALPERPSKPNRPLYLLFALVGALGVAAALVVCLELLNKGLYGNTTFEASLGFPILVSIPYVEVPTEVAKRSKTRKLIAFTLLIAIVGVPLIIHFMISPLDVLWYELARRLSVSGI